MENNNLIQCSRCKTWNNRNAEFCVNCDERLTAFTGEWWKNYNMQPVRLAKLKLPKLRGITYDVIKTLIAVFLLVYLSAAVAGIFLVLLPIIFDYKNVCYEMWYVIPSVFISLAFGILLLYLWFKHVVVHNLAPNWLRKRRKELLDDDFIENYFDRKVHYVFIARGTGTDHKFGLFDVQKIKVTVPFAYDSLKWQELGKTLLAVKDGVPMIIDVNGNKYN